MTLQLCILLLTCTKPALQFLQDLFEMLKLFCVVSALGLITQVIQLLAQRLLFAFDAFQLLQEFIAVFADLELCN